MWCTCICNIEQVISKMSSKGQGESRTVIPKKKSQISPFSLGITTSSTILDCRRSRTVQNVVIPKENYESGHFSLGIATSQTILILLMMYVVYCITPWQQKWRHNYYDYPKNMCSFDIQVSFDFDIMIVGGRNNYVLQMSV